MPFETGLDGARSVGKRRLAGTGIVQLTRERPGHIAQIQRLACQAMLRSVDNSADTIRAKADADDGNHSRRAKHQRRHQLAGEDRPRLALGSSVLADDVEWIAEMDDDLCTAVRQNRLRSGRQIDQPTLQRPDAANHARNREGRRVFYVLHGGSDANTRVAFLQAPHLATG
jgi:hypothetical protein